MLDSTKSQRPVYAELANRSIAPEPWRDGIGVRIYLAKIRQQRLMIVRLMLLGAIMVSLAGLAYSLVRTPAFTASSELLISNTTLQLSGPDAVVTQIFVENTLIQSAIEILKSSRVLERAVDRLGLENIELILPKSLNIRQLALSQIFAPEPERSETSRRQTALTALRSNITVNRVGASQIISVRGRALTAEDAARLTNEITESFVREQNDTNAVVSTSAALRERIKVLGPTARIISDAAPPNRKDGPTGGVMLMLAAIVGATLGMSIGLAITIFDRRVRSAEQLAVTSSAECFGYLPRMMDRRDLRWQNGGRFGVWMLRKFRKLSPYAHALHCPDAELADSILRRAVLRRARSAVLERSGSVPHFVGVTSCRRGEGKTTLAATWAGLIAGDGSRVLLIDASRDDAALSNNLTPNETQGLYQLLRGGAVPGDLIRAEFRPNLDFLPSGQVVGNIDTQWVNLVDLVSASGDCSYEWVIIDLPALTPVADVRSAGQIVDELLIVVEWGRTSEVQFEQALQSLGPVRNKILGAVINKTPWASFDSEARVDQRAVRNTSTDSDIRNPGGLGQLWKKFCGLSIVLGFALALAVSPAFGDDYRLGISDRLKIKVQEWPDLGGEYTVTADGSVSLPLVGDINAAGLHVKDLAREISDRLQRRAGGAERPFAAIEIIQFRPFSILGDVQRPGEYPYRPGLTVLQAIGIAGGYYRPTDPGLLRLERDIALARGDIRTLSLKQSRLVARVARLTAALGGQENVPIPPELMNQKDNPTISAIVESERAALAMENDTARSEASALEDIRSLYQREIGSLRGQVDALTQEQGAIQQQLKELRALSAKGLALTPTLLTLERTLAQIVNEQMSAETAIVRAEENITLAEQRVREHAIERNRTNTRDLQQAKDEIAEVRARIGTAGDLLSEAQFTAPAEARERLMEKGQRASFTLVRKDGEILREITADETTVIEPNDVIKIPLIGLKPVAASSYVDVSRVERSQEIEP
jgi:exopolysaccharide production protein ExoF